MKKETSLLCYLSIILLKICSFKQVTVHRNNGPDTFEGMQCNASRFNNPDGNICKCFDSQQTFCSYEKHKVGCYDAKSVRRNPDKAHEVVVVNNMQKQALTNNCDLRNILKMFVWDLKDNKGIWYENDAPATSIVNVTFGIYIAFPNRAIYDGLLVHFFYDCKDNRTNTTMVKFTGTRTYPLSKEMQELIGLMPISTTQPRDTTPSTPTTKLPAVTLHGKTHSNTKTTNMYSQSKKTTRSTSTTTKEENKDSPNIGMIVGIIISLILILILSIFCCIWRRRRNDSSKSDDKVRAPLHAEYTANASNDQNVTVSTPMYSPTRDDSETDINYSIAYESFNPEAHWGKEYVSSNKKISQKENVHSSTADGEIKSPNEKESNCYSSASSDILQTKPAVEYKKDQETNEYQDANLDMKANKTINENDPYYYSTASSDILEPKPTVEYAQIQKDKTTYPHHDDDPNYYSTASSDILEPKPTIEYAQVEKNKTDTAENEYAATNNNTNKTEHDGDTNYDHCSTEDSTKVTENNANGYEFIDE